MKYRLFKSKSINYTKACVIGNLNANNIKNKQVFKVICHRAALPRYNSSSSSFLHAGYLSITKETQFLGFMFPQVVQRHQEGGVE